MLAICIITKYIEINEIVNNGKLKKGGIQQ